MSLNSKENINIFAQVICDAFSNMFYHKGPLSVEGDLPERVYISVPFPSAIKCDSSLCTILDEDLFLQVITNFPDNRNFFFAAYRPAKFSSRVIVNTLSNKKNAVNPPRFFLFQEFMDQVHFADVISTKLYSLPRLREKINSVTSLGTVTINDPRNPDRMLIAYSFGKNKDHQFCRWHGLTTVYQETWVIPRILDMAKLRAIQDRSIQSVSYKSFGGISLLPKNDRCCYCFTIAMTNKKATQEAFRKLEQLAQEVYAHSSTEEQEFQRYCTPIVSTAANSNLIDKKHVAVFAVKALGDDELNVALILLKQKRYFHFVSRSKLLHLFASPEQVEDLRLECLTHDIKLPFGTKEGTFAIEIDHAILNEEPLIQFKVQDIGIGQHDHFQIPVIPCCLIADTIIDPNLIDYLAQELSAVNIRLSQVEDKEQGALKIIAFYAPTNHFPTIPCTFRFNDHQLTVQYKLPVYYDKIRVEVMNTSEDARAHYENAIMPSGDPNRLTCIMPIDHNTASFRRWQAISTAFALVDDKEFMFFVIDEWCPAILVTSSIFPADVRNFLTAVNENANNLNHHSLFRKIENLQRIDDSNESNSNASLVHLRLRSNTIFVYKRVWNENGFPRAGILDRIELGVRQDSDLFLALQPNVSWQQVFTSVEGVQLIGRHELVDNSQPTILPDTIIETPSPLPNSNRTALCTPSQTHNTRPKSNIIDTPKSNEEIPVSPTLSYEIQEPEEIEDERMTRSTHPEQNDNAHIPPQDSTRENSTKNYTPQPQGHATPTNHQHTPQMQDQQEADPIADFLTPPEHEQQLPQPANEQGVAFKQLQQRAKYNNFKAQVLNNPEFQGFDNIDEMINIAFSFVEEYPNELASFAAALRILAQGPLHNLQSTHIRQIALVNVAKGFSLKNGRRKFSISAYSFAMALSTIPNILDIRPLGTFYFLFRLFTGLGDTALATHYGTRIRGKCMTCQASIDLLYPFVRVDASQLPNPLTIEDIYAQCTAGCIDNPDCTCQTLCQCTIFDLARQLTIKLDNNDPATITFRQVEQFFNTAPATFGGNTYSVVAIIMKSIQSDSCYIVDKMNRPTQPKSYPFGVYSYIEGVRAADKKKELSKDAVQGFVLSTLEEVNGLSPIKTYAESSRKPKRQLSNCPSLSHPPANINRATTNGRTPMEVTEDTNAITDGNPAQASTIAANENSAQAGTIDNPLMQTTPTHANPANGAIALGGHCAPTLNLPTSCPAHAEGTIAPGIHNTHHITPKPNTSPHNSTKIPYMLISLFDGCGSTFEIVKRRFGYAPSLFLAAEKDETLRHIVAEQLGLNLREAWSKTRHQTTALYIKDVMTLFQQDCKVIKELVQIAKSKNTFKILLIGGSPCTELTLAEGDKGLLGITGPNSVLFFVFHLLMYHVNQLLPQAEFRFLVENAGSMKDMHYDAICRTLGISLQVTKASRQWCASSLSLAKRNRYFFRNYQDQEDLQHTVLTKLNFHTGWGPLLTIDSQEVPFEPFMRPRAILTDVSCRLSWSSYHPNSLVWHYDAFGGKAQFAAQAKISKGQALPQLPWERVIPSYFLHSWLNFLRKMLYCPSIKEKDAAIERVLPLFHNPAIVVPFRILTANEVLQVAGLDSFFDKVSATKHLLDDYTIRSLVGNSFHPALITAALGTREQCVQWMQTPPSPWQLPPPLSVINIFNQVVRQIQDNFQKAPKKQMQRTPYGKAPIQMTQTALPQNVHIAELAIFQPLPAFSKAVYEKQLQEQRNLRLERLVPGFSKIPSGKGFDFLFDNGYPASVLLQDITPQFFGCPNLPTALANNLHWMQQDFSLDSACCLALNIIVELPQLHHCGVVVTQQESSKINLAVIGEDRLNHLLLIRLQGASTELSWILFQPQSFPAPSLHFDSTEHICYRFKCFYNDTQAHQDVHSIIVRTGQETLFQRTSHPTIFKSNFCPFRLTSHEIFTQAYSSFTQRPLFQCHYALAGMQVFFADSNVSHNKLLIDPLSIHLGWTPQEPSQLSSACLLIPVCKTDLDINRAALIVQQNNLQSEHLLQPEHLQSIIACFNAGTQPSVLSCNSSNIPHVSIIIKGDLATDFQRHAQVQKDQP